MQELHKTKNFVVYATEDGGLKIEAPPGRSTVWFGTGRGRSHIVLGDGLALLPLMEGQAGWAFGHRYPAFDLIEVQE